MRFEWDDHKTLQEAELEKLEELSDEELNLKDIPEVLDWKNAVRGKFYSPPQKQAAAKLEIDADVLNWFQSLGNQYQTHINQILREYMEHHRHGVI